MSKRKTKRIDISKAVKYDVDPTIGLNSEQVAKRVDECLTNAVTKKKGNSIFRIICTNLFTFFNMLYLIIAIYIIYKKCWQNLTFLAVVVPNLLIGIFQEIKAKITIDKLSIVSAPHAIVLRNGEEVEIDVDDVVLDDIMILKAGDQVYADCVLESGLCEANEALLSGEAEAIEKHPGQELLAGSFIASGSCVCRAIRVGDYNYIEKMSGEVKQHVAPKSELLHTLKLIITIVGCLIPVMVLVLFLKDWSELSICAVVLAMIPAGLFLLTSIALFIGEINLAKKNTLVQDLYCIEMLARVNCLCLDKTGTITDGTMKVVDCIELKNPTTFTLREIIGSMLASFEDHNQTSDALLKYFNSSNALEAMDVVAFSSKRKYSAVTFKDPTKKIAPLGTFIIGAPEFVLRDNLSKVKPTIKGFTEEGNRVVVLGFTKGKIDPEVRLPSDVTPVAIIALEDHIRDTAKDTLNYFKENDVEVRVISGDDPVTVSEIAKRAGIDHADLYISLEGKSDEEVADIASDYYIFGRVSPEQKQTIIRSLQANGKTCAMTGDGVNDILALREADCSIAMASGADAARYASHLVLLDSDFASLPQVVTEGRRVINNIQRTSSLFLVKTFFGILLTLLYIVLQTVAPNFYEYPFKEPSIMMLIETITIGIPATILALQPCNERVKGKFIVNVINTIMPAVLSILSLHVILYFVAPMFNITDDVYSTIAVIITNICCLYVLYRVCKPFNWWKIILFVVISLLVFAGYALSMVNEFVRGFVHCISLLSDSYENILLLIVFLLGSYYIYLIFKIILRQGKK